MVKFFGLTGGIASGKSTVRDFLRALGAEVLDADAIYHELIAPKNGQPSSLARQIGYRFPGLLQPDGSLNRVVLAERVFAAPEERHALEAISHPVVAQEVARRVEALCEVGRPLVIYEVPLLFERHLEVGMDGVMVVWVPRAVQIARLMQRDGVSKKAAEQRIAAQLSLDVKRRHATWVADNSGTREQTREQTVRIWEEMSADP